MQRNNKKFNLVLERRNQLLSEDEKRREKLFNEYQSKTTVMQPNRVMAFS
jgi:hypothetical protein